jgi:P27 family predicted phage terminase small subunit
MKKPDCPKHLSPASRALWAHVRNQYHVDDAPGLQLLQALCEARDRADQAREVIRSEGLTTTDRFGQSRAHPAVAIERDARAQVIAAIRALRLAPDVEERR